MAANFDQKCSLYEINLYAILNIALIVPKQRLWKSYVYL